MVTLKIFELNFFFDSLHCIVFKPIVIFFWKFFKVVFSSFQIRSFCCVEIYRRRNIK